MTLGFNIKEQLSDPQIVREMQLRNERVAESFYNDCKRYFMTSYKAIFSREGIKDDIFQQSFVKLWTEIETRRIFLDRNGNIQRTDRRGSIRVLTCNLKTFLIDIAKNDYREWLRNDRLCLEEEFESFAHMVEIRSAVMPEESLDSLQEQIVASCVLDLPRRCKEILTMFYYENMSLDEIIQARKENTSKNGLKTGKHKCMETLKGRIKEKFNQYKLRY